MLAATFPVGTANAGSGQEQQDQRRTKRINDEAQPGAAPVDLTPAERPALLKAADGRSSATAGALKLGAKEKLVPRDVTKDADGTVHTRYERTFAGLPVLGGDLVVHTRGESRTVSRATGARISVPTTEPIVATATAKKTALNAAKASRNTFLASTKSARSRVGPFASPSATSAIAWSKWSYQSATHRRMSTTRSTTVVRLSSSWAARTDLASMAVCNEVEPRRTESA
ncbi:hypothetical protein [Streptomyces sp. 3214.6]|uniref:hypothetical protein n=1 Tax=Streptomyces sp. 3214.6 TaxID=1882757 RepID=UPI000909B1AC|nr:hypothetical protein [Streptomyces sp. 3214.6]SHH41344.1 Fungalysin/Thermolysin Propeptide Motif [Streptomyces sp. 3214.6]